MLYTANLAAGGTIKFYLHEIVKIGGGTIYLSNGKAAKLPDTTLELMGNNTPIALDYFELGKIIDAMKQHGMLP